MPFIANVSKQAATDSFHINPGSNSVLISIVDPCCETPSTKHKYLEVRAYEFLDIEDAEHEFAIRGDQAENIVSVLKKALVNDSNVIVHCTAGICRSGAVAEVGVILGFDDIGYYRQPNLLVKKRLLQAAGLYYTDNSDDSEDNQQDNHRT